MDKSELLRQSLARIQALKARVAGLEAAQTEPIAIVGMGLRFPGGIDDPGKFWAGLCEGIDLVREIPTQRWAEGQAETAFAAMLDQIYEFEPGFFGLSEREARTMDPQQRLLMEVAYDALTDAGLTLPELRGSATGVYVGASGFDWNLLVFAEDDIDAYAATGSSHAILANRLSYVWDLRGPSVSLDAACASSLVAVHLGVAALRRRECDRVLVGGVQAHLVPHTSLSLSRFGMMAADGRCKAFDSRADGFVRAEGCGVFVLARLSDVDTTRDRVYALIHGSAVNQDGRSNGLTAPNSLAQAEVLRAALADARVEPEQVGLIETHGTGTALGDPIEFQALSEAYGGARRPCYLGAVKTNLGHTEAAAGIAGLAKVALAIHHAKIPANLHLERVNPDIELAGTRFRLPRALQSWQPGHAGVSSFGFGGTNSHAILGPPPQVANPNASSERRLLVPISAASREAFYARVEQLRGLVEAGALEPDGLAYTLAARSTHHRWRGHALVEDPADLGPALADLHPTHAPATPPRIVFSCAGQGGQWLGMGEALAAWSPVFRATLARCEAAIRDVAGWSLSEALASEAELARVDRVQPAIFAMQVALAALWRSVGVEPDVVLGSSMGEVAAAAIAGLLSLEDAALVITTRSRLVAEHLDKPGAMATIALSEAEVRARLDARRSHDIELAVINSPTNVVVAGSPEPIVELVAELDAEGVFARRVQVDYASHCSHVDGLGELLERELRERISPLAQQADSPRVAMLSTVTLDWLEDASSPRYWQDNLRRPVLLWRALSEVLRPAGDVILELSPHPVLAVPLEDPLAALDPPVRLSCGMAREGGPEVFLDALGRVWAQGLAPRWEALWDGRPARVTSLPSYPWARRHYGPGAVLGDPRAARGDGTPRVLAEVPPPRIERAPAPAAAEAPVVDVEALVVATLTHELGANQALPTDVPLRALGLDSLIASHVRARLVERGFEITLLEIMQAPGIAALVARLGSHDPADDAAEPNSSPPVSFASTPASVASVGSLAAEQTSPASPSVDATAMVRRASTVTRSTWFACPRPRPDAEQIMYCVPYGGGSASAFRPWLEAMPPWLELRIVELPGRGARLGEPPPSRVDELIATLGEALLVDHDGRPFSLYGHCSGSLIAYELIRYVSVAGLVPRHLFVAVLGIPSRYRIARLVQTVDDSRTDLHDMSEAVLLNFLRSVEFQGLADIERDPALRDLAFSTMRTDSRLMQGYQATERPPLALPITVLGGALDPSTNVYDLWLWARETTARFDWRWFPAGNHYLLADHVADIAALFTEALRGEAPPPPRPLDTADLAPLDVVRACYAAFDYNPGDCARFVADTARWRVLGPDQRDLDGEGLWLVDPSTGPRAVSETLVSRTGEDSSEVLVSSSLTLDDDGDEAQHTARYRVHDGLIVASEVRITKADAHSEVRTGSDL